MNPSLPRIVSIDSHAPSPVLLAQAAEWLRAGELVAFPTETVYGLGANGLDARAVAKIFAAKGRPNTHPLILHVASVAAAEALTSDFSDLARALAKAFWPGPLTLVLPKNDRVPLAVTGGGSTVAIRIPAHPVALALVRATGLPIAAPSANPYQAISPTTAEHVDSGLGARVQLILDGGPCAHGLESTVVDVQNACILRPGPITLAQLQRVAPQLQYGAQQVAVSDGSTAHAAPGMDAIHYAPRTPLVRVSTAQLRACSMAERASRALVIGDGEATAADVASHGWSSVIHLPNDAEGYGALLYATLHQLDAHGLAEIWVHMPPKLPAWAAVNDRLWRASAGRRTF